MKRITVMGLSLFAVVALSALAASSAFAGEYGRCIKTVSTVTYKKVKGEVTVEATKEKVPNGLYENKECTKPEAKLIAEKYKEPEEPKGTPIPAVPEGKYEWVPGPGPKPNDTDKTGKATLTGAAGVIECAKSTSTGTITGVKTDKEAVLFSKCSTKGAPCTTVRITGLNENAEPIWTETTAPGTIETFPLDTEVIDHGEYFYQLTAEGEFEKFVEPAEGEAWTLSTSSEVGEENPYKGLQAVYECKEVARIFTAGALAGVTPNVNKMETNLTTTFEEGKGLQNLFSDAEVGGKPPLIPIGRGIEKTSGKAKGEEKNEIRTENVGPIDRETGFEAVPPPPPAPSIEQVEFTAPGGAGSGPIPTVVDHATNGTGEASVELGDVGEKNNVQWQKSAKPGDTKNWPVGYVKKTKPTVKARFAMGAATEAFIKNKLVGKAKITGEATIGGEPLKFKTELTKAELEANAGSFTTKAVTADTELPNKVLYESVTITWKWEVEEAATPPAPPVVIKQQIGQSTHNFYLTEAGALVKGLPIYLTLLDLATQGIEAKPTEPVKGIWSQFATLQTHLRWYEIEPGTLHRNGKTMTYWEDHTAYVGKSLEAILKKEPGTCANAGVPELLKSAEGQCGAWALAFAYALEYEGISSQELEVLPNVGPKCGAAGSACSMLVKNWGFAAGGGALGGEFPYKESEVTKEAGVAAQGDMNPTADFLNHFIEEAPKGSGKLYDPSYGNAYEGGEPLKEFQEKSIAGFCLVEEAKKAVKGGCKIGATPPALEVGTINGFKAE